MSSPVDAILAVDKAAGPTSFDVVRSIRRHVDKRKVGHSGSLDPFATGLLLVMVGRATKLSNLLLNADKSYSAVLKLGEQTDSLDCTGKVVETAVVPELSEEFVHSTLKSFEGVWNQTPPMYSAKKIKGVRLYELARKNIEVQRSPVPVNLYRVEAKKIELPYIHFEVHCSKGTYIRSLADEIGKKLGTLGHLSELRRLSCGDFSIEEGCRVDEYEANPSKYLEKGKLEYQKFLKRERILQAMPERQTVRQEIANAT